MYFRNDKYIYIQKNNCQLLHLNIIISLNRYEKQNVGITSNKILFQLMFHGIPPINLTLPKKKKKISFCDPGYKLKCLKFNHFEPCWKKNILFQITHSVI